MGEILVTQSALTEKKNELTKRNNEFKKQVEELVAAENKLNGMWDGDANTAFHNAFTKDKGQMDNFHKEIQNYVNKLEQIIQKYAEAESKNQQIASKRTY